MVTEYIAQPVMSTEGLLLGVNVMIRFAGQEGNNIRPSDIVKGWSIDRKRLYLYEVLGQIASKEAFFINNNVFCSLSIDHWMATLLRYDSFLIGIMESMPYLKLQVTEQFPQINKGVNNPVLKSLSEGSNALFLGDLGAGTANVSTLVNGLFEAVRMDEVFFNTQYFKDSFPVLIKNIKMYCGKIIVPGIGDRRLLPFLREQEIWGIQGSLYRSVPFHKVQTLI